MRPDEWLCVLKPYQLELVENFRSVGSNDEEIAERWLSDMGADHTFGFGVTSYGKEYFSKVKFELHKMICGDPAYESFREELLSVWAQHKAAVVLFFASTISAVLGIAVGVLVPVVALLLSALTKVGVNAWCEASSASSK